MKNNTRIRGGKRSDMVEESVVDTIVIMIIVEWDTTKQLVFWLGLSHSLAVGFILIKSSNCGEAKESKPKQEMLSL